jgi:hypothetical protein
MAFDIELVRPEDLLNLQLHIAGLRVDASDPAKPVLVVEDPQQPAFLTVTFPPQTIAEPAYFEASIVKPGDANSPPDERNPRADSDAGNTSIEPLDPPGQPQSPRRTAAQLGHPSRLVFSVPADARIPFSIEGLLDWSKLQLNVNPIAAIGRAPTPHQIAQAPGIRAPAANETAIELPYRLVISPTGEVAWQHRAAPFTARGRTELWHTRLALKLQDGITELSRDNLASLRAIWSPDFHPNNIPPPTERDPDLWRTAMSANDRHQIVVLTSAFHGYQVEHEVGIPLAPVLNPRLDFRLGGQIKFKRTVPYVPDPFEAEQLMLSPLGGWLKSRGHWTPPHTAAPFDPGAFDLTAVVKALQPLRRRAAVSPLVDRADDFGVIIGRPVAEKYQLDLSEWVHIATLGRDHYVRIVYEGELWPFRHRAALIKITERKFRETGGIVGAYMIQRMFIVVREPERLFAVGDRGNPFKRVRLTTLVTPDIADPSVLAGTDRSFWVEVMTSDTTHDFFRFHAVGTDVGGNPVDFTVPLMFVSISDVAELNKLKAVALEYNAPVNIDRRTLIVPGQKLLFAEQDADPAKRNDNSQLVTQTLNFVVDAAGAPARMLKAEVKLPAVQDLLGTDTPTTIAFFKDYVAGGLDAATGVFAQVVKEDLSKFTPDNPLAAMVPNTLGVNFSADKAGGFATPNLGVSTLTRSLGPLAGRVEDAVTGSFDPKQFFPKGMAQLFGCFDLFDLLPLASLNQNAPKLQTRAQDVPGGKLIITTIDWEPTVQNCGDDKLAAFKKDHGGVTKLLVHGTIQKTVTLGAPPPADGVKAEFTGTLNDFQVSVLQSVFINFDEFGFGTRSGQKPDVKVKLDPAVPVEFGGDLKFVEELRKAIPPDLFGKGPSLDISPTGVRAGFAFALPPLAVGVFALKDVSLGAALTLPFLDGKPVFDFNVSERPHPFLLTVSLFAGGGFFHLQLDTAGMKQLEVALEFGAAAAIDIGVASGEVHIMAGIYFSLQRKENSTDLSAVLTGYLRMGGSLSVLGLIKISVEFNLSFTYDSGRDKAYGRATLTVQVEVLCFSKSVELTVERAFGGSGDPHFGEMFDTPERWSEYALAFA